MSILCSTRVLNAPVTGVQRYTIEVLNRLPSSDVERLAPPKWLRRPLNLLWEQTVLPLYMHAGALLWSPANVGPLGVRRQVVTVHDLATVECPEDFSTLFCQFYDYLFPRLLPRVAGIITVSEYTRQKVLQTYRVEPEKVRAIPLGVDHSRFKPQAPAAIEAVRNKLNLPHRYILYLGSVTPRKNVQLLVRAWAKMQDSVPDVRLVIAGGEGAAHVFRGSGISDLPARSALTGRIEEADLAPLLAGASVFVFPSFYEGFGLPPLEAMACGAPCIASDATSLPEVVGDAAITISPYDVDALAEALEAVLSDPALASQLREKGLIRAAAFSWDRTAAETWRVLTQFN
jgi:glycosyltransferase involved in cell wall biosynthesis